METQHPDAARHFCHWHADPMRAKCFASRILVNKRSGDRLALGGWGEVRWVLVRGFGTCLAGSRLVASSHSGSQ